MEMHLHLLCANTSHVSNSVNKMSLVVQRHSLIFKFIIVTHGRQSLTVDWMKQQVNFPENYTKNKTTINEYLKGTVTSGTVGLLITCPILAAASRGIMRENNTQVSHPATTAPPP